MQYKTNFITGSVLGTGSLVYLFLTFDIQVFQGNGATPLTNRFIPRFWGTLLFIFSIMLIIRAVKEYKRAKAKGELIKQPSVSLKGFFLKNYEVILSFVFLAIYIALLEVVGFVIMSICYLFVEITLLTPRGKCNYPVTLLVSVIASVLVDFVFVRLLFVLLPVGLLGF